MAVPQQDGLAHIILYYYSRTRVGETARTFLEGFQGYLMADSYSGYNKVSDIRRCCCYAHIRRYFIDAIPKGHEYDMSFPVVQGADYCSRFFYYEDKICQRTDSHEKRKKLRIRHEKPVIEALSCGLASRNL